MRKRKSFRHLDQNDRDRIEILLKQDQKRVDIAEVLKVDKSTISREIKKRKRKNGIYDANTAEHKAYVKRLRSKYQGMKIESNPSLKQYIALELKDKRSPDEISGRMKQDKLSFYASKDAIYKWLYSSYGQAYCKYLCTHRYKPRLKKKDKPKRVMIPDIISISERPSYGLHWEGDTMLSPKKAKTTASVAVASAIEAKYIGVTKIPNLKPDSMRNAISDLNNELQMDSLTLDRGIENRKHKEFGVDTYFCDAHSPWQKPHVENAIGLIRRWFLPKGTDLSKIKEKRLQKYIYILNHKYRKSLGYKSAYEVARDSGILKRESIRTNLRVAFGYRI